MQVRRRSRAEGVSLLHDVRSTRPRSWRIRAAEGLALLHAENLLTNAGAETKLCRGGVVAPRRPDHTAKAMAHPRRRGACAAPCGEIADQCRCGDEVAPRGVSLLHGVRICNAGRVKGALVEVEFRG